MALLFGCALALPNSSSQAETPPLPPAGNPVFLGWYADPEGAVFDDQYWIFPTYSAPYDEQTYFDAFSSPDLIHWTKYPKIVDTAIIPWAKRAMWAPGISRKDGRYYFFFSANDIQKDTEIGGIGVAVADHPQGPYKDLLGKPLLNQIINGAQPIDVFVFTDADGQPYLLYGGWGHCNIVKLNGDYTGFVPAADGQLYHEITPQGYVEGPCMYLRNGKYYFLWSEGGWTTADYNVNYAIGDSPLGPFKRFGSVILPDAAIGTGAGGNTLIQVPGQDTWFITYHRRPPGQTDGNARVVCVDRLSFNADGTIQPVKMTNEGVGPNPIP